MASITCLERMLRYYATVGKDSKCTAWMWKLSRKWVVEWLQNESPNGIGLSLWASCLQPWKSAVLALKHYSGVPFDDRQWMCTCNIEGGYQVLSETREELYYSSLQNDDLKPMFVITSVIKRLHCPLIFGWKHLFFAHQRWYSEM